MKTMNNTKIIGIDHGYGNMKTANHCFLSGILSFDAEPLFTGDMLTYNGKYYLIGEGHKEFIAEKVIDEDYYTEGGLSFSPSFQYHLQTETQPRRPESHTG